MTVPQKKTLGTWAFRTVVVALLGSMVSFTFSFAPKAVDAINNRTFDSYEQKVRMIQKLEEKTVVSPSQRDQLLMHMGDTDRHMSATEKEQLIIIRENQKRIGQDLQEIKNLLRNQ